MKSIQRMLIAGAVALTALGMANVAQARSDVYWSLGVGAPGAVIGVGNVPPAVYAPPVYVAPPPVYMAPPPVYVRPRPVYVAPPPVYYGPPQVVYRPYNGWRGERWERRRWRHHRDWDDD